MGLYLEIEVVDNQVKIRSLGWVLIHNHGYFYKMGKCGHKDRHAQRKENVKTHGKKRSCDYSDTSTIQRIPRTTNKHEELRRRKKGLSSKAIRESMALWTF